MSVDVQLELIDVIHTSGRLLKIIVGGAEMEFFVGAGVFFQGAGLSDIFEFLRNSDLVDVLLRLG